MSPIRFLLVCLLIACAVFSNATSFDFHPKIALMGFNISPTDTESKKYGQTYLNLPADIYFDENFSLQTEYFLSYSYFDRKEDFYNKLDRLTFSFNKGYFELKAGRDFLDLGLAPVIYFGNYENKDLKRPSYFDGATASYKVGYLLDTCAFAGQFDEKELYGITFGVMGLKGFYFLAREQNFKLSIHGAAYSIEKEKFSLFLLAAFNGGKTIINHYGTIEQKHKGKIFAGTLTLRKEDKIFNTEMTFGAEYLSPDKEDSLGYKPIFANFDRGFIFGNLTEENQTLTYKIFFTVSPSFWEDLSASIKMYNFIATDKRLISRDIANEIDFTLLYHYKNFALQFLYGYLQEQSGFDNFAPEFAAKDKVNKIGLILSYQF